MVVDDAVGEFAADNVRVRGEFFEGRGRDEEVVGYAWVVVAVGGVSFFYLGEMAVGLVGVLWWTYIMTGSTALSAMASNHFWIPIWLAALAK